MTTTVAVAMPSLLELMVNARLSTHLMGLEILLDCVGTEAFDRHRGDAWGYAEQAGFLYHDQQVPAMFIGEYELEDAWHFGRSRYEEAASRHRPLVGDEVWFSL